MTKATVLKCIIAAGLQPRKHTDEEMESDACYETNIRGLHISYCSSYASVCRTLPDGKILFIDTPNQKSVIAALKKQAEEVAAGK